MTGQAIFKMGRSHDQENTWHVNLYSSENHHVLLSPPVVQLAWRAHMCHFSSVCLCCGQLWVWHMFCGQDLWWATIPLHISIVCVGIPFGFQTIIWTFARHLVSRPQGGGFSLYADKFPQQGSRRQFGSFQFLPTGLHGLCFGCCVSGPLPLRSLTDGPLFRVCFGESLVVRLYSEIDHIHLSIEAQCVSTLLPLGDCHSLELTKSTWPNLIY